MLLALELKVKWVNLLDIYCELGLCTGHWTKPARQDCLLHPTTAKLVQPSSVSLTLSSFMPDQKTARNLKSRPLLKEYINPIAI